jgi:predicted glycoside hydrolase/deacetylase ChbG (UPF0249 family)
MRYLVVTADDFGIGPATTAGILQLGELGVVKGTVLMVNSPFAAAAAEAWARSGKKLELGWHPVLTNDRPILPPEQVPSLVGPEGTFFPLSLFLRKILLHQIRLEEVRAELTAQYQRCTELIGTRPMLINTHHHVHIFSPIASILLDIIMAEGRRPYLRLVREPWPQFVRIPGARGKRLFLNWFGRRAARVQRRRGLAGNDWLIGVTNPKYVHDDAFFVRLIKTVPGNVVELTCHPGHYDPTLIGRDCTADDGMLERRVRELKLLSSPAFSAACAEAGFTLISPRQRAEMYGGFTGAAPIAWPGGSPVPPV